MDGLKFKEVVNLSCFGKKGFLKWAEINGVNIPLLRDNITKGEWRKIKNNVVKQINLSHNL